MDEQKRGKKRPKSYYIKCAAGGKKQNRSTCIEPGMKGFLVTCNKYERETVREMYNILNEYADKLYGPEKLESSSQASMDGTEDNSSSEEEDMEKAMAKETAAIKQASTQKRRFQNTNTKTKNIVFIRTTVEDPSSLAHSIFEDMYVTQVQKARYAQRIIPVSIICKVDSKTISAAMETVLAPQFRTEFGVAVKYTAICKIRNNNTMSRTILLPLLNKIILEMNPLHQLCHDEPDLVIVIEVMRGVCCLSVVKDFFKFRKYNFHEIVKKVDKSHPDVDGVNEESKECDTSVVKDKGSINGGKNELDDKTTVDNEKLEVIVDPDNKGISSEHTDCVGGVKNEETEKLGESTLGDVDKDKEMGNVVIEEASKVVKDIEDVVTTESLDTRINAKVCEPEVVVKDIEDVVTTESLDTGINAKVCKPEVVPDLKSSDGAENNL